MNTIIKLLFLTVCAAVISGLTASAQESAAITSLPFIKLAVSVTHDTGPPPEYEIHEGFSTSDPARHTVICASAYFDVRYQLYSSNGALVVGSAAPWQNGPEHTMMSPSSSNGNAVGYCKIPASESFSRVLLSWVYPNLKRGTYKLIVTLHPRGSGESASSPPIGIEI